MCLSSSLSKVGYLSSLMKGLLRPVVRVRIPGLTAPLPSINSPSTSLEDKAKTDKVKYYDSIRADLSMIHDEDKKKEKGTTEEDRGLIEISVTWWSNNHLMLSSTKTTELVTAAVCHLVWTETVRTLELLHKQHSLNHFHI